MDHFVLNSGSSCILERRPGTGVVAVQVWVGVGSKDETDTVAGITHFIEHLIFKGSAEVKANQMASRIEALGGSVNAFTSYDNTVYHIVIPSKGFELGTRLLLDAVLNPAFPAEEIYKEKKVVLEEIKMGEDDPQRKLFKELFALSYRGHPYGRPIIGYEHTVQSLSRASIQEYFASHYRRGNVTIVIVGDFDQDQAVGLISRYGNGGRNDPVIAAVPKGGHVTARPQRDRGPTIIERDLRESYIACSYRVPALTHEDTPALDVLSNILGDGESSRFQEALKRKEGLVTHISTHLFAPKEDGLLVIYATFTGNSIDAVRKGMEREVEILFSKGVTQWELEKAKNMLRASFVYGAETVQGRARQIGNFETLTGDRRFLEKYLKALDSVTEEIIRGVVEKYMTGKMAESAALLPRKTSNPHTFTMSNGMVYVANRNRASPSFSLRIGLVGGLKQEPPGKNGIFNILSRMLLKGTQGRDTLAIAREIDLLAGDITPFSARNVFGLTGKFLSKDFKEAVTILSDLLMASVFSEETLGKVKEEVLSDVRKRDDDPVSYTFRRFNETLYEGHPYSRDPIGSETDVSNISVRDLREFYERYVSPVHAVLSLSGDVDGGESRRLLDGLFSPWKGQENGLRKETAIPRMRDVQVIRDIKQVHLIFGFLGPGLLDEDRYAVEVMDGVLSGMGGRVHRAFREDNPCAYATTFFNQMAFEAGGMGIYVGTNAKLVKDVERIARSEIERMVNQGFTEREVEDAKNYLIGNHYISVQSNSTIAAGMCLDTMYGLKPGFFKEWPGHIEKVKAEDANRVARKYLSLDTMVSVKVGALE
jgi:zinc protease